MEAIDRFLEDRLWTPQILLQGSIEEWDALAQYVVSRFAAFICQRVSVERVQEVLDGRAICLDMNQAASVESRLSLEWTGTFSISVKQDGVWVSATIFTFIAGDRVVRPDRKGDYLWYRYVRGADGVGNWEEGRWMEDEYEEFIDVERPQSGSAGNDPATSRLVTHGAVTIRRT